MKLTFKSTLALLTGVALFYTSCKKDNSSSKATGTSTQISATATAQKNQAAQIATNLVHALSGTYGGVNVNDGVSQPGVATHSTSKAKINSLNYTCGFFVDNGIHYTTNIGDSLKSVSDGSLSFYFKCTNGIATGYTAADTLTTIGTGPGYSFADGVAQNYVVTGLNPNNSLISVDGTIKSSINVLYTKTKTFAVSHNEFILTGLQVQLAATPSPDITSGTAIFIATGKTGTSEYALYGTLTFLGNHRAKIDYYNSIYYVDTLTGKVTTSL